MTLSELIVAISLKHAKEGIVVNPPASKNDIQDFEKKIGFSLPEDFREFYSICNGFGCNEDIFNITPLNDIIRNQQDYGENWFCFSEYMIYSDTWMLRKISESKYEIFNASNPDIILSNSLHEFLNRFLIGNVFDKNGLYDWQKELT